MSCVRGWSPEYLQLTGTCSVGRRLYEAQVCLCMRVSVSDRVEHVELCHTRLNDGTKHYGVKMDMQGVSGLNEQPEANGEWKCNRNTTGNKRQVKPVSWACASPRPLPHRSQSPQPFQYLLHYYSFLQATRNQWILEHHQAQR